MYVKYQDLVKMLNDAYCAGRELPFDLCTQAVEEILINNKLIDSQDFHIYTAEELRNFQVGTKFCHSLLGIGEIASKSGMRARFMKFDSGITHGFSADAFPWDMPMLYLGERIVDDVE